MEIQWGSAYIDTRPDRAEAKALFCMAGAPFLVAATHQRVAKAFSQPEPHIQVWSSYGQQMGQERYIPVHFPACGLTSILVLRYKTNDIQAAQHCFDITPIRRRFPDRKSSGKRTLKLTDLNANDPFSSLRVTRHDTGDTYDLTKGLHSMTPPLLTYTVGDLTLPMVAPLGGIDNYGLSGLATLVGKTHKVIFELMRHGTDAADFHGGVRPARSRPRDTALQLLSGKGVYYNAQRVAIDIAAANAAYRQLPVLDDYLTAWLFNHLRHFQRFE